MTAAERTRFVVVSLTILVSTAVAGCRPVSGSAGGAAAAEPGKQTRPATDTGAPARETAPAAKEAPPASSSPRWRATADAVSGTVMRVEGVAQATPGPRLAGYLIRSGTERPLSPEHLGELVALVRSGSGFDDSILKRCPPGESVGFRLFRKPPGRDDSPPATELVLDFGCAKLTVAEAGSTADVHATYFDPSRSAFVAFVKRVLPRDPEITKLR